MFAADWSNLTVAGAFIVGAIAGAVATARVIRLAIDWLRRDRDAER